MRYTESQEGVLFSSHREKVFRKGSKVFNHKCCREFQDEQRKPMDSGVRRWWVTCTEPGQRCGGWRWAWHWVGGRENGIWGSKDGDSVLWSFFLWREQKYGAGIIFPALVRNWSKERSYLVCHFIFVIIKFLFLMSLESGGENHSYNRRRFLVSYWPEVSGCKWPKPTLCLLRQKGNFCRFT